jgi:hypothetical protein
MAISRSRGRAAPGGSDVYTGLLGLSLGALIVGCVFLYMDWAQYPQKKPEVPPAPNIKPAAGPASQPAPPR